MTDHGTEFPAELAPLRALAANLRWSWHAPTTELFRRIDAPLWEATHHNPVRLLAEASRSRLEAVAADATFIEAMELAASDLRAYLAATDTWFRGAHPAEHRRIAYFSAEFGVAECLRIYAGGLGVLAGDHLKSASDLGVPLVAVGLMYREGYFTQRVDALGMQRDEYERADFNLLPLTCERRPDGEPLLVTLPLLDRTLLVRVWRADVGRVPLYLLDTDVEGNSDDDRRITDRLYGGDTEHRLRQELVLGVGGLRALHALGVPPAVVHLNEGHAAFAAVEHVRMLQESSGGSFRDATQRGRRDIVFTTHTPVAAGHDYFPRDLLERYIGGYVREMREPFEAFVALGLFEGEPRFCMTALALRLSSRRNGVSRLHGEVSREMWGMIWPDRPVDQVPIRHVTNGVHLPTWTGAPTVALYERYIGERWSDATDEMQWHRANHIPREELWATRRAQRAGMIEDVRLALAAQVARRGGDPSWTTAALDPDALTIVFARRFATYKRAALLLRDEARIARLLTGTRPVQFVFAGKAHPRDEPGKLILQRIRDFAERPDVRGRFVFIEGYDLALARSLVHGADVWLNVPVRPHEASGTSGMKAMANGALNLSIPDGWWAEAWTEHNRLNDAVGWSIQAGADAGKAQAPDHSDASATREDPDIDDRDARLLYGLLENEVVPLFHERSAGGIPVAWCERMRAAIRQLVPYFNTHRMVAEYVDTAYYVEPDEDAVLTHDRTASGGA